MATVQQIFKKGISTGDWEAIRRVYKALTKEEAPYPPSQNLLDIELDDEEVVEYNPMEADIDDEDDEEEDDDDEEEAPSLPLADDFRIQHKGTQNKSGKVKAKFRPLVIPKKRKNLYKDDLTLHADELVTKRPELGTASRVQSRASNPDAADTSKKVAVVCSLCGTSANVSALLAFGYNIDPEENTYRCDQCCTPSGRKKLEGKQRKNG